MYSVQNLDGYLPDLAAARYIGTDACGSCHRKDYASYLGSSHAKSSKTGLSQNVRGCEQCHGPGSIHVQRPGDPATINRFNMLSPQRVSEICLSCHEIAKNAIWMQSPHLLAGVGCTACHYAHPEKKQDLKNFQGSTMCFTCHQEKKAAMLLPSRHPVKEGKMTCATCHDSHGAGRKLLKKTSVNEQCLECHGEYQGPFAYEHAPVTEDCSICHEPHGTVANNLLRQDEPFLCLRCHRAHRNDPDAGLFPTNTALLTSCSQCHGDVHGTDQPSRHRQEGNLP